MSANQLRAQVRGEVFAPGDVGYDEHRLAWDRNTDQHPVGFHRHHILAIVGYYC